jgi:nicotinate-nucleotide adenylyltransferase
MPVGEAPHRSIERDAGSRERFLMCELAARGVGWLDASQIEVDRPGPSYTVDTLRGLRDSRPADELVWLLGADQAAKLPDWREPEDVLRLARIGVARRDGVGEDAVREAVSGLGAEERLAFFEMPSIEVSSTMVRERVAAGRPFRFLVTERVADRIEEAGLYRGEGA